MDVAALGMTGPLGVPSNIAIGMMESAVLRLRARSKGEGVSNSRREEASTVEGTREIAGVALINEPDRTKAEGVGAERPSCDDDDADDDVAALVVDEEGRQGDGIGRG